MKRPRGVGASYMRPVRGFSALRLFLSRLPLDDVLLKPSEIVNELPSSGEALYCLILLLVPPEMNMLLRKLIYEPVRRRGPSRLQAGQNMQTLPRTSQSYVESILCYPLHINVIKANDNNV